MFINFIYVHNIKGGGNNMNNYVKENFALDLKEDFEIADFKKRVNSFRTKRSYMNLLRMSTVKL